jgi:hypothetical protein
LIGPLLTRQLRYVAGHPRSRVSNGMDVDLPCYRFAIARRATVRIVREMVNRSLMA